MRPDACQPVRGVATRDLPGGLERLARGRRSRGRTSIVCVRGIIPRESYSDVRVRRMSL